MRVPAAAVCFMLVFNLAAQKSDLSAEIAALSLRDAYEKDNPRRGFVKFRKASSKYNPLSYVGGAILYAYQNVISEQIQAACVYEISCSEFTRQCISSHGFFAGMLMGFNQLSECFNGAIYEHSRLFINSEKKIVNPTDEAAR